MSVVLRNEAKLWIEPAQTLAVSSLSSSNSFPHHAKIYKLKPNSVDAQLLEIFLEVFSSNKKISDRAAWLVRSFIPDDEMFFISELFGLPKPMPRFVNLIDPAILKKYLGPDCQSPAHLLSAGEIVKRIYEKGRYLPNIGTVFPTNPEPLAYATEIGRDETVLEIAGASGENGILLAFSGAKKVYVNEILQSEMKSFHDLKARLPLNVGERLEAIEGSCFDILKKNRELANRVIGLILCRNLIHFFNDQKQTEFFQLLKQILKPGGYAIIVVNSIYSSILNKSKTFAENPDATSFDVTQCLVHDFTRLSGHQKPLALIFNEVAVCPQELVSFDYTDLYVYEKNKETGFKWQANNEDYHKLAASVRDKLKQVFLNNKKKLQHIPIGAVRVTSIRVRFYNKKTLTDLVQRHGFDVASTFFTEENGHLIGDDADLRTKGAQMGVIITLPPA